ncbi:uncharacterized protein LOC126763284 [Bactrocera neohumeralis]|uniref:uncharacterized protein LOC126763284 n=1 Tax=Bactrocera neohumeralis TaxID=98809 RepID=UPI00216640F8|nr:uncharacterized protein LOC126763284 [Bactrocera neohumeralis]
MCCVEMLLVKVIENVEIFFIQLLSNYRLFVACVTVKVSLLQIPMEGLTSFQRLITVEIYFRVWNFEWRNYFHMFQQQVNLDQIFFWPNGNGIAQYCCNWSYNLVWFDSDADSLDNDETNIDD